MSGLQAAVVRDLKPGRHLRVGWSHLAVSAVVRRASPIFGRVTF